MRCPSCMAENTATRRFCAQCGAALPVRCPACGFENEPTARFCGGCGSLIAELAAPQPVTSLPLTRTDSAERRQLTVMFCDLVGSTELAVRLDPEDLREVIGAYHRAVAEIVAGFDGFVAKYMGDGVLVYFGYPQAHEDDVERAVRAGLGIIDAVGRLDVRSAKLQARIGIATGLVVVGDLIGEGSAQEQSVVGETPNLAARLQALAEPDTIVIAEGTRRLAGDLFDYHDLGAVEVRGLAEAVQAWQVLHPSAVESRFEALHGTALTPLVGRGEEIELLVRRWQRAKSGEGQVVLVSGEPGIGKSRLLAALDERLRGEPHTRLRYFCSPHHGDSTLYPFVSQIERAAGFERDDRPRIRLDKLETLLAQSGEAGVETVGLFADLLGISDEGRYPPLPQEPQQKRELTLTALLAQFQALARRRPVLMIFEDAHWADSTSLELLDRVVERMAHFPALLLIAFRPEFTPPWIGQAHVSSLSLRRLAERETADLISGITADKNLPAEVLDRIVERTDGIPLFVEELTKTLLEGGLLREEENGYALAGPLPPLAIPSSLQDSLMARLDRLASGKAVAQISAALGREFSYDLLAAVAQRSDHQLRDALDQLTEAGLVFRRGTSPRASFMFKHALVQDAAYSTLLRSQRLESHARIAKALTEQFPETAETQPEILAHHYTQAGMNALAVEYWQRAGERALQRSAHLEAVNHLRKGLSLIKLLESSRDRSQRELDIQIGLGMALHVGRGQSAPEVIDAYERARQLCAEVESPRQLFRALMGLYRAHVEADTAANFVAQLFDLAQKTQDPDMAIEAHMAYGTSQLVFGGDLDTAQHHLDEAITRYARNQDRSYAVHFTRDPGVVSLSRSSWALWFRGYPDQSLEMSRRTLTLASELGHVSSREMALWFGAMLHQFRREPDATRELAQSTVALAREHHLSEFAARAGFLLGWAMVHQGRSEEGYQNMRESFAEYRRIGGALDLPWYLGLLAEVSAAEGHADDAFATVKQAERVVRTGRETSLHTPEVYRIKGELQLRTGRQADAEQSFRSSLEIARQKGARTLELRSGTSLARLRRDQGRPAEARDLLAPIYGWFTEGFDTADLKEAKALLDELT
jgi:class 3 adenylate cyclase/predicted ATPase